MGSTSEGRERVKMSPPTLKSEVVLHEEGADGRAEAREGARVERMREGEGAGRGHALRIDGRAEELGHLHHLGDPVPVGHGVARDDDGPLGLHEEIGGGLDGRLVAADARRDAGGLEQIDLALGVEHVHGQRDEHGAGGMGAGRLDGAAHRARQIVEPGDLVRPLHVGAGHRRQIRPEDRLGEIHGLVVLPGGEEERRARLHRRRRACPWHCRARARCAR